MFCTNMYQYVPNSTNLYCYGTCIIWRCEIKPKGNGNKIILNVSLNKKTNSCGESQNVVIYFEQGK